MLIAEGDRLRRSAACEKPPNSTPTTIERNASISKLRGFISQNLKCQFETIRFSQRYALCTINPVIVKPPRAQCTRRQSQVTHRRFNEIPSRVCRAWAHGGTDGAQLAES